MGGHLLRIQTALSGALLGLVVVGCSGPDLGTPVDVSGKLTVEGKPVEKIHVSFTFSGEGRPAEFRNFRGTSNAQGEYQITGMYPGSYLVSFAAEEGELPEGEDVPAEQTGPLANVDLEGRTADVSADSTTFDFDLKSSRSD